MNPEDLMVGAAFNHEPVQEDLVVNVVGLEFLKHYVLLSYLGDLAFEGVEGGKVAGYHIVGNLCLD